MTDEILKIKEKYTYLRKAKKFLEDLKGNNFKYVFASTSTAHFALNPVYISSIEDYEEAYKELIGEEEAGANAGRMYKEDFQGAGFYDTVNLLGKGLLHLETLNLYIDVHYKVLR